MTTQTQQQWLRDWALVVIGGASETNVFDLSELKFRFRTQQFDEESPNNCEIRVYNLSPATVKKVREEYSRVKLSAGYKNSGKGEIFDGTIRQFRTGRESQVNSYLDILAADGDIPYGFGIVNETISAGATQDEITRRIGKVSTEPLPIDNLPTVLNGTESLRGKVLFGMARDYLRDVAKTNQCTWSIQNGKLQMVPFDSYLPGDVVTLDVATGLIGVPELTEQGVQVRCLINPKLRVGGLIRIDNARVNRIIQANENDPRVFNSVAGIQHQASLSADGLYRVYVIEHTGDNRGNEWYSDLTCLAVNNGKVAPFGILKEQPF